MSDRFTHQNAWAATLSGLVLGVWLVGSLPASAAEPILPGYWATTNRASSIVTAPTTKSEKHCISASQIESFLTGFSNHHYKCHNSQLQYGDGALSMTGVCADRNGLRVTVEGKGSYTPDSFRINFQILLAGVPVAHAVSDAHRLSATCPTDTLPAPPKKQEPDTRADAAKDKTAAVSSASGPAAH